MEDRERKKKTQIEFLEVKYPTWKVNWIGLAAD